MKVSKRKWQIILPCLLLSISMAICGLFLLKTDNVSAVETSSVATGPFTGVNVAWNGEKKDDTSVASFIELQSEVPQDLTSFSYIAVRVRHMHAESTGAMRTILIDENGGSINGANYAFDKLTSDKYAYFANADFSNLRVASAANQYYNHIKLIGFDGWLFLSKPWFDIYYSSSYPGTTTKSIDWTKVKSLAFGGTYKDVYSQVVDFGEVRVYTEDIKGKSQSELNALSYTTFFAPDGTLNNVVAKSTDYYVVTPRVKYDYNNLLGVPNATFEGLQVNWGTTPIKQMMSQSLILSTDADFTGVTHVGIRIKSLNSAAQVIDVSLVGGSTTCTIKSRAPADYSTYPQELGLLYDVNATNKVANATQYWKHVGSYAGFDGWLMMPIAAYPDLTGDRIKDVNSIVIRGNAYDYVAQKDGATNSSKGICGQSWVFGEIRAYTDLDAGTYTTIFNPTTGEVNQTGYIMTLNSTGSTYKVPTKDGYFDGITASWDATPTSSTTSDFQEVGFRNQNNVDFTNFSYLALRVNHRSSTNSSVLRVRIKANNVDYYIVARANHNDNPEEKALLYNVDITGYNNAIQYFSHVGAAVGFNGWIFIPKAAFNTFTTNLNSVDYVFVGSSVSSNDSTACGQVWDLGEIRVYYDTDLESLDDYKVFSNPTYGLEDNQIDSTLVSETGSKLTLTRSVNSFKVKEVSLSLGGEIGVNYYVYLGEQYRNENTKVEFTVEAVDGREEKVVTVNWTDDMKKKDGNLYCFQVPVSAADMTRKINAVATNGSTVIGTASGLSVAKFAEVALGQYEQKYVDLIVAMLNYGAEAQKLFGVATDELANSILSAEQQGLVENVTAPERLTIIDDVKNDTSLSPVGISLLLKTNTTIRFYLSTEIATSTNFSVKVDASQVEVKQTEQGWYYFEIENISAADMDNSYHIEITSDLSETGLSFTYSVIDFASTVIEQNGDMVNLGKALKLYNDAANVCFE